MMLRRCCGVELGKVVWLRTLVKYVEVVTFATFVHLSRLPRFSRLEVDGYNAVDRQHTHQHTKIHNMQHQQPAHNRTQDREKRRTLCIECRAFPSRVALPNGFTAFDECHLTGQCDQCHFDEHHQTFPSYALRPVP